MNIQRFTGATAREALAKARHAFGEGTLILSNRQTALGVEVMATTEDSVSTLDLRASAPPAPAPARTCWSKKCQAWRASSSTTSRSRATPT